MTIYREDADAVYRRSFGAFVCRAFEVVYPGRKLIHGWHIDCLCYLLQQMVEGRSNNHLVANLPPRSLKSFIISVCLVAWLFGAKSNFKNHRCELFTGPCRQILPRMSRSYGVEILQGSFPHTTQSEKSYRK